MIRSSTGKVLCRDRHHHQRCCVSLYIYPRVRAVGFSIAGSSTITLVILPTSMHPVVEHKRTSPIYPPLTWSHGVTESTRDTHDVVHATTRSSSESYSLCYRRIYTLQAKDITRDEHHVLLHNTPTTTPHLSLHHPRRDRRLPLHLSITITYIY